MSQLLLTDLLSEEKLARVTQPLPQAYTLPPEAYTDPEIYELEKKKFWGDVWHPVARIDQVSKAGDYLSIDLFGQPLMVVHGQDGNIRVMSRTCLHRAAPVAQGCGNANKFTCPYHAWTYDTTGQLIRAPLMEQVDDFDEQQCQLPQAHVTQWCGFVMANFADQATPFEPQVQSFKKEFAPFGLEMMEVMKTLEYRHQWNWKVLVDNFMEAYHHIAIHNTTFEPNFHARDSRIPDNDGPWSILHMPAAQASEAPSHNPMLSKSQQDDLYANIVFPMFLLGVKDTSLVWYQILPQSHDDLILRIHICLPGVVRDMPEYNEIINGVAEGVDGIHQEDIYANNLVWQGLTAPLTKQGRLSTYERSLWQFNQWWVKLLSN